MPRAFHSRLFALAVLSALALSAPAFAAKEEKGGKNEPKPELFAKDGDKYRPATEDEIKKAGHDDHKSGGLDFTGIKRYDLGIYTLVVFGALVFIITKFAWPHIKSGLEKREASIGGALAEAKRDREEAEARLADAKKQLAEAAMQAKAIVDEARRDAESLKVAKLEEGAVEAQAIKARAEHELGLERDSLLKEVNQQAVELASLIATKAIRQQVSIDKHSQLVNESIAELMTNTSRA